MVLASKFVQIFTNSLVCWNGRGLASSRVDGSNIQYSVEKIILNMEISCAQQVLVPSLEPATAWYGLLVDRAITKYYRSEALWALTLLYSIITRHSWRILSQVLTEGLLFLSNVGEQK